MTERDIEVIWMSALLTIFFLSFLFSVAGFSCVFFFFTSFNSSILLCPLRCCRVVMLKTAVYCNYVHSESLKNSPGTSTKLKLCYIVIYTFMHHNDTTSKTDAWRKTLEGRHRKTSFQIYLHLALFVRFACERMLETERKLYILTPLLWPSRCVLFSWCWGQLHRSFPRTPSVGCGLPLPHLVSTVWNYTGNCIGGFRGPSRLGVAFPTTSGL